MGKSVLCERSNGNPPSTIRSQRASSRWKINSPASAVQPWVWTMALGMPLPSESISVIQSGCWTSFSIIRYLEENIGILLGCSFSSAFISDAISALLMSVITLLQPSPGPDFYSLFWPLRQIFRRWTFRDRSSLDIEGNINTISFINMFLKIFYTLKRFKKHLLSSPQMEKFAVKWQQKRIVFNPYPSVMVRL